MNQKNQNNYNKKIKAPRTDNVLEALRDIGGNSARALGNEAGQISKNFVKELFGVREAPINAAGDLEPGQSLEMDALIAQEREENKVLKLRLVQEQRIREEEKVLVEKEGQKLKLELQALIEEVKNLAQNTQDIAEEIEIAAMQAPANPGVYHVIFFEKLRELIKSFRKKVENAAVWLHSYNQRAAKRRGFWGQVAKSGSKRLLSGEDYSQRSAG